ncbi:tRNA epoxyqueuosine(34) reductase QueG [Planctomicrobium sp. SH664]|uniref:tRNA epoxyqueuosine(34) reductase QueG n=1 Tax=Planctomicrobium sp. SH664 TaxID=3448125 RepID=UPI003F5C808E
MTVSSDDTATDGSLTDSELAQLLKERGGELGFELMGIAPAARPLTLEHFQSWLQAGFQGEMLYLARREAAYAHPEGVLPAVRTVIMAALNYGPGARDAASPGRIAAYAQGSGDYHEILRSKLRILADLLHDHRPGCQTRVAVDTAPLLERDVARRAGLGWFGKNTMLINKHRGSYFFLGAVLTDAALPADAPHETSHCGTCTRCLEACPTDAFEAPYVLNASKCISYLTIELRKRPIPSGLRAGMQDWMFGCDVCQQVCPWNRKGTPATAAELIPDASLLEVKAEEFLRLSAREFRLRFGKTPLARPGREGMARNAAVVLGNRRDPTTVPVLIDALQDESAIVRGAVVWALGQVGGEAAFNALSAHALRESDVDVVRELSALGHRAHGDA